MDNFCFKSDVSADFSSAMPFKGEIDKNAGHLITASVSSFTVTTSKKKTKKKPYHESRNGSTRTIMVYSHFGSFNI